MSVSTLNRDKPGYSSSVSGRALFTFAVIADSHLNPNDDESSSPWLTNRLSNARTRHVIQEVNAAKPAFVVHLGDIVHPVPAASTFAVAAQRFRDLFGALGPSLYVVPGNHDVGDKPLAWMPAATVRDEYIEQYRRHFGADYFSFDSHGCHFVVLNCQLINSGLRYEVEQQEWFESDLAANHDKRIFVFSHYPPYIAERDESSHYDNIDEPGRSWLLNLLERHHAEALLSGHVHNFFYNRHGGTDLYVLPSISFVRHDYSEMYRCSPTREYGRDDLAKLGYMLISVHGRGHVPHVVRTYGVTDGTVGKVEGEMDTRLRTHARTASGTKLAVDLRHPWCELIELPYSGAVDEFYRKRARNDYPLLALWEMGIRRFRIPSSDLASERTRERMRELVVHGHEFVVFSYRAPEPALADLAKENADLFHAWEVIAEYDYLEETTRSLAALQRSLQCPMFVSRLRTSADTGGSRPRFDHFINHGFSIEESELVARLCRAGEQWIAEGGGVIFRVGRDRSPLEDVALIADRGASAGVRACAHVRLANDNPAVNEENELGAAAHACKALCASWLYPEIDVVLDTFVAHDRGYFPRAGLIDRACNPTLPGRVLGGLNAALSARTGDGLTLSGSANNDSLHVLWLRSSRGLDALIMAQVPTTVGALPGVPMTLPSRGTGVWIELGSGRTTPVAWLASQSRGGQMEFDRPQVCPGPVFFQSLACELAES